MDEAKELPETFWDMAKDRCKGVEILIVKTSTGETKIVSIKDTK